MKLHMIITLAALSMAYSPTETFPTTMNVTTSSTKTSPTTINITSTTNTERARTHLQIEERVVGGFPCKVSNHPDTVSIQFANSKRLHCAGSLVTEFWVLTAAHCCYRIFQARTFLVVAGVSSLSESDNSGEIRQSSLASRCKIYKHYDDLYLYNDIALLQLESPIKESATVGYAKLPPKANLQYDELQTICSLTVVMGWGDQYAKGPDGEPLSTPIPPTDNSLQCIFLPIISMEECEGRYQQTVPNSVLCAFEQGKDACQGDSGGPLVCDNDFLYGVVSSGFGCAFEGYPGLYTRVDLFLDFINETITETSAAGHLSQHLNCYIFLIRFMVFLVLVVNTT